MPHCRMSIGTLIVSLTLGLLAVPAVTAHGPPEWKDDDHSYDKARRAVERGEALPVSEVMKRLRSRVRGEVVSTDYEHEFDRWVYEFKVIDAQGSVRIFHIDAASGEFIEAKHD